MVLPETADSETLKTAFLVPPVPSTRETSRTDTVGVGSLSTIVPVASPSAIAAPDGENRWKENCSSSSSRVSPMTGTSTVFEVSPGAKVADPLTVVKSTPAVDGIEVAYRTEAGEVSGAPNVI